MNKTDSVSMGVVAKIFLSIIGVLLMTVGATTMSSIDQRIDHIHEDMAHIHSDVDEQEMKLTRSNEKIDENQIIIREILTEIKWQKAEFGDLKQRVQNIEGR